MYTIKARSQETEGPHRLALAHFALSALSLLGVLDTKLSSKDREEAREWIYAQQLSTGGFRGSNSIASTSLDTAHLINSYAALLSLLLLEDALTGVYEEGLMSFVVACQEEDGSFAPYPNSTERDVRSTYAAFAICRILDCWSSIDVDKAVTYLLSCKVGSLLARMWLVALIRMHSATMADSRRCPTAKRTAAQRTASSLH